MPRLLLLLSTTTPNCLSSSLVCYPLRDIVCVPCVPPSTDALDSISATHFIFLCDFSYLFPSLPMHTALLSMLFLILSARRSLSLSCLSCATAVAHVAVPFEPVFHLTIFTVKVCTAAADAACTRCCLVAP